jgi:hypothetical protein
MARDLSEQNLSIRINVSARMETQDFQLAVRQRAANLIIHLVIPIKAVCS